MQTFTNHFQILMNQDKTEVILNFTQNIPEIKEDGAISDQGMVVQPVANLAMTGQMARNLANTLLGMLTPETQEQA